jgi:hypothetical protein
MDRTSRTETFYRLRIEMICRFIQEQDMRLLPSDLSKYHARFLSAREGANHVQRQLSGQAEAGHVLPAGGHRSAEVQDDMM